MQTLTQVQIHPDIYSDVYWLTSVFKHIETKQRFSSIQQNFTQK